MSRTRSDVTSETQWKSAVLFACLLSLALPIPIRSAEAQEKVPASQDPLPELVALRARVEALEAELGTLRTDYDARLRALEEKWASFAPATSEPPAPTENTSAEPAEVNSEEGTALAQELAEILGETQGGEGAESPTSPQDQTPVEEREFVDRARTLTALNPEVSVTADVFGTVADSPESSQFEINEFEVAFQAPLDPFSLAKAFVVQEEGEIGVEEAYIDWTSLPAGLGLKFGQYRQDWGKLNRWHQHALAQTDRPLVHQAFFGDEGLSGLGVGLSWLAPTFLGDYNELWLQVTNDENDVAFSGRGFDEPVILLHETNYWDLSSAAYIEVGFSAATGVNDELGRFRTQVYGVDWNFDWRPPAQALYKGVEVRGELLWERREEEEGRVDSWGAYAYATYKLNRQWYVGLRGDWTELPREPGADLWGISPYVEWWQSEWTRLRVQYSYVSGPFEAPENENRLFFQVTWALGPHKHEKY